MEELKEKEDTPESSHQEHSSDVGRILSAILPAKTFGALRSKYASLTNVSPKISRQSAVSRWCDHYILRQKPTLFSLDVHVTDHCNLKCKGCTHFSNISPERFCDITEYRHDLERTMSFFKNIEQILVMGGEPCLHPQVTDFIYATRELAPRSDIQFLTNGLLLPRMKEDFWEALRETNTTLLCNNYPIHLKEEEIVELAQNHGINLVRAEPVNEFFGAPLRPEGAPSGSYSYELCRHYNNCALMRDGRLYLCGLAGCSDIFREHFGLSEYELSPEDSFDLSQKPTLKNSWKALNFLLHPSPWCEHCDYAEFHYYPWEAKPNAELSDW